jgi:tRNA A-37 threonylcarbamoyl transferase component Bud32
MSRLRDASGYAIREVPTRGFAWLMFLPPSQRLPEGGWKLHVSVSTVRADENIAAVVRALLAQGAAFKVPATLDGLIRINSGQAGITQVGKTVTVYPASDDHLALISRTLRDTRFVPGPRPPSDYVVDGAPGQSIRWGAFGGSRVRWTALGRPYVEIRDPGGAWIEDSREPLRTDIPVRRPVPSTVQSDLSVADGPVTIGADTVVPVSQLSHGPRSRVDLALRMPAMEACVLKRARVKVAEDLDGNCARVRLANEARMLTLATGADLAPSLIAYAEDQDALVMSDESGEAIQQLRGAIGLRRLVAASESVGRLHAMGIVHRDAKLANAVWHRNGRVVWVDFELAAQAGERHPIAAGTHGYIPPEGTSAVAHPSYDVYSIGASLAKWCLGIDPSRLPLLNTRHRIRRMLLASGQTAAETLYTALTAPRPALRPSAAAAAAQIQSSRPTLLAQRKHPKSNVSAPSLRRWAGGVANRGLPALDAFEGPTPGTWRNSHIFSDVCCTGINIGASGILLGLMHLCGRGVDEGRLDRWIRNTADSLCCEAFDGANRGFFTGSSGAAVALAVAGTRLREPQYTQRAIDLLVVAAATDDGEFDLFSGDAGVLWAGAHIARMTRSDRIVDALRPLAQRVRKRATRRQGMPCWPATPAYDPQCKVFLGAAHGASGIALGLAEWARLVGGRASAERQMAQQVFESIFSVASDTGQPNTPETLDGTFRPPQYWCHGVAGYLWCLLQSFPSDGDLRPALLWATRALNATSRDADLPTMCHGLAGMLEVSAMARAWAMAHGSRPDVQRSTDQCNSIAFNLRCLQQPFRQATVWSSEDPAEVTPDLWVGFLGPVVALHRYARGDCDSMLSGSALARLAHDSP